MTIFLKFDSKEQAVAAVYQEDFIEFINGEARIKKSQKHDVLLIDVIYKATGVMLVSDGFEYPEILPVAGYHVNLLLNGMALPDSLQPFVIYPVTPSYSFGDL